MFSAPPLGAPHPSQPAYGTPADNAFATPAANANGAYGAQPQQTYPPQQQAFAQPPAGAAQLYSQQAPSTPFGSPEPPPSSVPVSAPNFTPSTQTSSIGFASPNDYAYMGQTNGAANQTNDAVAQLAQPEAAPPENGPTSVPPPSEAPSAPSDPALLSMNVLSGQQPALVSEGTTNNGGTMADQAYAKLVNMDAFDLVKGGEPERNNPFEAVNNSAMSQVSLADMKSKSGNVRMGMNLVC